jgi:hypothetical protein
MRLLRSLAAGLGTALVVTMALVMLAAALLAVGITWRRSKQGGAGPHQGEAP